MSEQGQRGRSDLWRSLQMLSREEGVWRPNLAKLLEGELSPLQQHWRIDLQRDNERVRKAVSSSLHALIVQLAPRDARQPLDLKQREKQYQHAVLVSFNIIDYPELRNTKLQDRRLWLADKDQELLRIAVTTSQRDLNHAIDQIEQILTTGYQPIEIPDRDAANVSPTSHRDVPAPDYQESDTTPYIDLLAQTQLPDPQPTSNPPTPGTNQPALSTLQQKLGIPVSQLTDPFELEVHRAIATDGSAELPQLPMYVRRSHDEQLVNVVKAVASRNKIAVLVGGSSTGKTRACWEIVKEHLPGWRLWHPIAPNHPQALLDGLSGLKEHTLDSKTVLWLNELQHYLLPRDLELGERVAAELRELLRDRERGSFLILATMWPEEWDELTRKPQPDQKDPHPHARALLAGSQIPVRADFSDEDMAKLMTVAPKDPRLALAVRDAGTRVAQFLAGGFELIERYESAPSTDLAVLHAAGDASRLGVGRIIPELLLETAAEGYLADHDWQRLLPAQQHTWFADALTRLQRPCKGVPGPLTPARIGDKRPVRETRLALADYLDQHIRKERRFLAPAGSLWDAVANTSDDADTLVKVAHNAFLRLRKQHAFELYRSAFNSGLGSAEALYFLIDQNRAAAEQIAQRCIDVGNIDIVTQVAHRFGRGIFERNLATRLFWMLWQAGDNDALYELAVQYENANMPDSAREMFDLSAATGNTFSLCWAAVLFRGTENRSEALRLMEKAAGAGHIVAACDLAAQRESAGDLTGAKQLYEHIFENVSPLAMNLFLRRPSQNRDDSKAKQLPGKEGTGTHILALYDLALWQEGLGNNDWAASLRQKASSATLADVLHEFIIWRYDVGDPFGAAQLYVKAAAIHDLEGIKWLAEQQEREGDIEGADRMYRAAIDGGSASAVKGLMRLYEKTGNSAAADELAKKLLAAGDSIAVDMLRYSRHAAGDYAGAERIDEFMDRAGDQYSLRALAWRRAAAGDLAGARQYHERAAGVGDVRSMDWLARHYEQAGDLPKADQLVHQALSLQAKLGSQQRIGDLGDFKRIVDLRKDTEGLVGAERMLRMAVDLGHTTVLSYLAELYEETGNRPGAVNVALEAPASERPVILTQLARRVRNGDPTGALRLYDLALDYGLYDLALDYGDIQAIRDIADLQELAGDIEAAKHNIMTVINAGISWGVWNVSAALVGLYRKSGDQASAEAIRRYGLDADGSPASPWEPTY
jgi:hypothetical protein